MADLSGDDAARRRATVIEQAFTVLVIELGCVSAVNTSIGLALDADGIFQGSSIDLIPTATGPALMSVMVDGGSILGFSMAREGIVEFVNTSASANLTSLVSTVRQVTTCALVEDIQVGRLRATTRHNVRLPAGNEKLAHASLWRTKGDPSEVVSDTPYPST